MPALTNRRDTPAQDRAHKDRRTRQDVLSLQHAGLQAQDRRLENDAVTSAVSAASRPQPVSYGNSGSPTLREVGQSSLSAMDQAVQGWRSSALEADRSGPQAQAARGGRFPSRPSMPDMPSMPRGSAQGSGFTDQQLSSPNQGWGQAAMNASRQLFGRLGQTQAPGAMLRDRQAAQARQEAIRGVGVPRGDTPASAGGYRIPQVSQEAQQAAIEVQRGAGQARPQVSQGAVQGAQAMMEGARGQTGYYTDRQGNQVFVPGTQRVQDTTTGLPGVSSLGDMGAANESFARANALRQEMIDRDRPQNQVTVIGQQGIGAGQQGGVDGRIASLAARLGRESDPRRRAQLIAQLRPLERIADRTAQTERSAASDRAGLQRQSMSDNAAMERAALQAMGSDDGMQAYREAQANYYNARTHELMADEPPEMPDVTALRDAGYDDVADAELARWQAQTDAHDFQRASQQLGVPPQQMIEDYFEGMQMGPLEAVFERMFGPRDVPEENRYAMGGEVAPPMEATMGPSAMGLGTMGEGAEMPPAMPESMGAGMSEPPMMAEYERYREGAMQAGVPAVPYEEFINLMPQAQPMPEPAPGAGEPYGQMGFADGGMVPDPQQMLASQIGDTMGGMDVSGREVLDPDPMAGTDSIPAVIDGQYPAALDSGEFVIPEHVVRFHGLDKLQKLIAQAEKGASNGQRRATESV